MRITWRGFTVSVLATVCGAALTLGAERGPEPGAPTARAFYGFCMETHDAKKRPLPEQAALLRELQFDGAGYPLWLDEQLEENLAVLDQAGLKAFLFYAAVNLNQSPSYDARIPRAIAKLRGRPATVCLLLHGFPPRDPRGEEPAIKALRELGDGARQQGLRISVYHHTKDWAESLLHVLQVVDKVNHPQVGANFNLCHWLMVDGDKDYEPVLREHANKIFAVTINGAQRDTKVWTNGLIQPLDRGDFDNQRLLQVLDEIGYRGPIGLMCYGIPGDAREHLERSMKTWQAWRKLEKP